MERHEILRREIRCLVFDQYGTIVDMQKGLVEAVTPFLAKKGWTGKPNSFVTWWRRTHYENSMIDALCDRGHTPYRQIGHRAVSYVMDRCGFDYSQDEVRWLVSEIERLKPLVDLGGYIPCPDHRIAPDAKFDLVRARLREADVIVLATNRLYRTIPRLPERYPVSTEFYRLLFEGRLGYVREAEFTAYPGLLGLEIVDDDADEVTVSQLPDRPAGPNCRRPAADAAERRRRVRARGVRGQGAEIVYRFQPVSSPWPSVARTSTT